MRDLFINYQAVTIPGAAFFSVPEQMKFELRELRIHEPESVSVAGGARYELVRESSGKKSVDSAGAISQNFCSVRTSGSGSVVIGNVAVLDVPVYDGADVVTVNVSGGVPGAVVDVCIIGYRLDG